MRLVRLLGIRFYALTCLLCLVCGSGFSQGFVPFYFRLDSTGTKIQPANSNWTIDISGISIDSTQLPSNVTLQGNTFNGGNQLVQMNASGILPALNGSLLQFLDASNIVFGELNDARLSTNVTLQGNTFNGGNQLVKLNGFGYLPAINGSMLQSLNASNLTSGTLGEARLSGTYSNALRFSNIANNYFGDTVNVNYLIGNGENITNVSQANISNLFDTLSTKENLANKVTSLSSPNNTTYPTTQAVSTTISAINQKFGDGDSIATSDRFFNGSNLYAFAIDSVANFKISVFNNVEPTTRFTTDTLSTELNDPQLLSGIQLINGDINLISTNLVGNHSGNATIGAGSVDIISNSSDIEITANHRIILNAFDSVSINSPLTNVSGSMNSIDGYRVNNTAPLQTFLKSDGLNYTPGSIEDVDIPANFTRIVSKIHGIDAKIIGTTNLYTVPVGKTFTVSEVIIHVSLLTSLLGPPTIGIGIASGESDIVAPVILTGLNSTTKTFKISVTGVSRKAVAGDIIKLGIDTGATASTMIISVYLKGDLE